MPKINREEYEVLKGLDDKWKWIARDKDNTLVMGAGKNERYLDGWFPPVNVGDSLVVDETNAVKDVSEYGNMFQFIQWKNEEPYNIAELIEEYEEYEFYDYVGWEYYKGEEAEMKDIEWLKEETNKILRDKVTDGINYYDYMALKSAVDELINQLDEPEVLSQKWIDEHAKAVAYDGMPDQTEVVYVDDLQNLLLSQELPVIPNYVDEWISEHREKFDLCPALRRLEAGSTRDHPAYKWYRKNTRKFVNAYLTGEYEIEQEPKYYAKIKGHENIASNDKYWNYNTDMEELSIGDSEVHPNVISEYTIKATKEEWANLGITDDNAEFELVEELEE